MAKAAIRVWRFEDAPRELQDLSVNGGDEDWLLEVPPGVLDDYMPTWVYATDSCGEPDVLDHPKKKGWHVIIGSHA